MTTIELLKAFLNAYFMEHNPQKGLVFVTKDVRCYGFADDKELIGVDDLIKRLSSEALRGFIDAELKIEDGENISEESAILHYSMNIHSTTIRGRMAGNSRRTPEGRKLYFINNSVLTPTQTIRVFEKELDENRKKEQLLLAGIPGGVAIYRMKKDGSTYADFVSDGFAKISGYGSGKELCAALNKNAFATMFEDDAKEVLEAAKKSLATQQPISIMYHAYAKNGDILFQRMEANIISANLAEDEQAVWYAVHTLVSDSSKRIIQERQEQKELIDEVPTGIGIFEIKDGKTVKNYMNNAFYRMIGSTREGRDDYLGKNTLNAVHPDDQASVYGEIKKVLSGDNFLTVDYRHAVENGVWFWVHLAGTVVERKPGYIRIYAALSDYNTVKKNEQYYEQQLRLTKAATADALSRVHINLSQKTVMTYDAEADEYKPHARFRDADELLASVKVDIPNENEWKKYECVADCDTIIRAYKKGITHYEIMSHVHDTRWTKAVYDVLENVYTGDIEMISSIYDVTEQVRSELVVNKLMEIAYKSILLIDNKTGLALPYKRDGVDDSVDEINAVMEENKNQEKGLEAFFRAHALPDKVEEVIQENSPETIANMLETQPYYECMYALNENGKLSQYKVTYSYLEEDKRILLSAVQDVTQVYEKEVQQREQLSLALVQADAASKAKSEFLSRMSHEIRTPMNAIMGMTAIAQDNRSDYLQVSDCLSKIESSSQYLLTLINDILEMSRIESGKTQISEDRFDFAMLIEGIRTVAEPLAQKSDVRLEIANRTVNGSYFGDCIRIQQIMINLLGNALKFTKKSGRVRFAVSAKEETETKTTFEFMVEDTGIGMSEKFMQKMFEPFAQEDSTTTSQYGGSGLGLAISKSLVDAMGGTITAESMVGVGTNFTVRLPLEKVQDSLLLKVKEMDEMPQTALDAILKGKHILMAEDHPMNVMVAQKLLERKGIQITVAENGKIAVETFRNSDSDEYDAILMDIRMPVMDGLEAARQIRALDRPDAKEIPIIAMTANALDEDRRNSKAAGMDEHLAKPIEPKRMYQMLAQQIVRRTI